MKHGERFLEDWRAMVVLGPTLATCFQESVCGRLLPRCPHCCHSLTHSRFHNLSSPPVLHHALLKQQSII